jgi:hypothetical protein
MSLRPEKVFYFIAVNFEVLCVFFPGEFGTFYGLECQN